MVSFPTPAEKTYSGLGIFQYNFGVQTTVLQMLFSVSNDQLPPKPHIVHYFNRFLGGGPQNGFTSLTWDKIHRPFQASYCSPAPLTPFFSARLAPVGPPPCHDLGCWQSTCQASGMTAAEIALLEGPEPLRNLTTMPWTVRMKQRIVHLLSRKCWKWR